MAIPDLKELEHAAREVVHRSIKAGTVGTLTPRIIRQKVARQFELEPDALDGPEYKHPLKSAIAAALEDELSEEEPAELEKPLLGKRKSTGGDEQNPKKLKVEDEEVEVSSNTRKLSPVSKKLKAEDEEPQVNSNTVKLSVSKGNSKIKSAKNQKTDSSTSKPSSSKTKLVERKVSEPKKKVNTKYKSREHVATSDVEMDEPDVPGPISTKKVTTKDHIPSDEDEDTDLPTPKKSMASASKPVRKPNTTKYDSESEVSVLDDEPPKSKPKKKVVATAATSTSSKGKKSSNNESKDEATVKRLKSLVNACGVRKIWSKFFQEEDSPKGQIKKLKELLTELGMTGRMSMEQAKAIKEKRELAKELEDVQQFEQKIVGRSSRSRSSIAQADNASSEDNDSEVESTESDSGVKARRRAASARKSISRFLADQSDDD